MTQSTHPSIALPFSQACENNKGPILDVLLQAFRQSQHVLEIGSGTAQHAVHFARHLPHVLWQTSDQAEYLTGIQARCQREGLDLGLNNLKLPLTLDVTQAWPINDIVKSIDAVFTANTLHIMSKTMVEAFFDGLSQLENLGTLCIYGPFNYQGQFTSDSNRQFDAFLRQRDAQSGIRDIEWIIELAQQQRLLLSQDVSMPANNRVLHFIKG
ncbi:class I SAM-dependent methyltransferase [Shewanella sp. A25]|nr:class I SAM-dependent methyltransferase [Shewanella shenzhenensis]